MGGGRPEPCPLGVNGGEYEMAPAMEADAAYLRRTGWVR
jgi:hypothetical protein